jgi:hypothetical protein
MKVQITDRPDLPGHPADLVVTFDDGPAFSMLFNFEHEAAKLPSFFREVADGIEGLIIKMGTAG